MISESTRESYYLHQYRILIFILFKDLTSIKFNRAERFVRIEKMSQFSAEVGYRSYRIRKGLQELERLNIIHDLKFAYNKASFYVEKTRV